VLGKTLGAAPA